VAKTVKFNLRFGDKLIRTVEDLQENFAMEDVLIHFENGLLKKFLERREYTDYVKKIDALSEKKLSIDLVASELVSIFELDMGKDAINEYAEVLHLRRENRKTYENYIQGKMNVQEVIEKHFEGYYKIVSSLIEDKNDLGKIKARTQELLDTYENILEINWLDLYFKLDDAGALYPIYHMLTKEFFRDRWLVTKSVKDQLENSTIDAINEYEDEFDNGANPWIKKSNKADASYWEDIVASGKTYMVLYVPTNAKVREPGNFDNEMESSALNYKFITFNGIQYRHNSTSQYIFFVEV